MLKKMLKHDMRAMWRTSMPMLLVSGIISVVCCAMMYFTLNFSENVNDLLGVILLVGGFYGMGIMAILILQLVISIFALVRYYKALFTDEGYLTMVLPMPATTLINEKILFVLIWWAVAALALTIGVLVAVVLPIMMFDKTILSSIYDYVMLIVGSLIDPGYDVSIGILNSLLGVVRFVENAVLTVAAITVGATVIKKRRLLGAFLFYFGISFVRENVVSVFEALIDIILVKTTNVSLGTVLSVLLGLLISAGITALSYFVMRNIFTKKFNIE